MHHAPARCLALTCVVLALLARALGQTPEGVILLKGPGFQQTSATAQESYEAGYAIVVLFPAPVALATTVQLVGPGVMLNIPRVAPDTFSVDGYGSFESEAELDRALPDGNYSLNVSGGGAASTTPVTIPARAAARAPLITNFEALQSWTETPLRIEWEPFAGGTADDMLEFSIERASGAEVFSTPTFTEAGALNGASTGVTVPSLNASPGERLHGNLMYAKLDITLANANRTFIATGRAIYLRFPLVRAQPQRPVIALQPRPQTVVAGSTVAFSTSATGATGFQWRRNGVPVAGATGSTYVLTNAQAGPTSFYTVDVTNSAGSVTSDSVALTVLASSADPGRISNLAIRSQAGIGAQTLIVGVAIGGAGTSGSKALLIRGVGPALAGFGVPDVLGDPRLEVYSNTAKILENDNWGGNAQVSAIASQVGAFSLGAPTTRDAALYSSSFTAGTYSVQVTGSGGATGVALAEIYDATPRDAFTASTPRLTNVSARTQVGTGGDILIAGFVIAGQTSKTVLIRAVGPTLAIFGVPGVLIDPKLEIFSAGTVVNTNDNWGGEATLVTMFNAVGAFPIGGQSRDAALLVTLAPGNYSAQVSGTGNTTGIALVEVYEVP